jgi:hypothetical protein
MLIVQPDEMRSPCSTWPPDNALPSLFTTPGPDATAGRSAAAADGTGTRVATAIIELVPTARARRRSLAEFLTIVATMSSS